MISLDNRSRDILLTLLRCNKPLAARELASPLGITPRMVRYSLRRAEAWLKERGVLLESRANYGILIDCEPLARTRLVSELEHLAEDSILSSTDRLHIVILALLTAQEPVLVKQLEHQLFVSRPTVLRDLRKAESWLRGHNLSVASRPHFGFQVFGRERDWREAIVSLLLESSGKKLLLVLCTCPGGQLPSRVTGESGPLREFLQTLDIPYSKSLLDTAAANLHLQVSDSAYVSLVLHLSLLISRTRQGKTVEFPLERLLNLSVEKELEEARVIAQRIQRYFKITLAESEVAFVAAQLLAVRNDGAISNNIAAQHTAIDPQVWDIVEGIVTEASNYLYPSLKVDQELKDSLALHLKPVLIQLLFELPVRNPLLEHIKRQYPFIFQVARKSSATLEAKMDLHLPEEEIGYIALHLGSAMERLRRQPGYKKKILVVCSEGVATARLLASKIRAEMPDVEVVEVLSLLELQRINKASKPTFDAIVATLPLEIKGTPVIVINPLLRPDDITRLREALELSATPVLQQPVSLSPEGDIPLSDLITLDMIRLKVSAGNWLEVVDKASEPLVAAGAIEPTYVKAMKQVISKFGPYSVTWPGVVLLHARPEDGVRHLCMSLATLSAPVRFGHPENDPVDVALVIGTVEPYSHLRALMELTELLADERAMAIIRRSSDRQEVREIISRFAHE